MGPEIFQSLAISAAETLGIYIIAQSPQIYITPLLFLAGVYHIVKVKAWILPEDTTIFSKRFVTLLTGAISTIVSYAGLIYIAQNYSPFLVLACQPGCMAILRMWAMANRRKRITEFAVTACVLWLFLLAGMFAQFGALAVGIGLGWSVFWHLNKTVAYRLRINIKSKSYAYALGIANACLAIYSGFCIIMNPIYPESFPVTEILLHFIYYLIGFIFVFEGPQLLMTRQVSIAPSVTQIFGYIIGFSITCMITGEAFFAVYLLVQIPVIILLNYEEDDLPIDSDRQGILTHIFLHKDSKRLALFLTINLIFMFVEAIYGYWTNSLGLISDAFHMGFDCTALSIGLYASYISKFPPDINHPFGYVRHEVLSGFINGVFLVFVGLNVFVESIERILEPPEIHTEMLLLVSVLGLIVNLVGLFFFHEHSHDHNHDHDHAHDHDHHHEGGSNMQGVFLHVLADTLGSVGVIVSSLCIHTWQLYISDPICSLVIAFLIILSVFPLLQSSMDTLLEKAERRKQIMVRLSELPGVADIRSLHVWALVDGKSVAAAVVEAKADADILVVSEQCKEVLPGEFSMVQVV